MGYRQVPAHRTIILHLRPRPVVFQREITAGVGVRHGIHGTNDGRRNGVHERQLEVATHGVPVAVVRRQRDRRNREGVLQYGAGRRRLRVNNLVAGGGDGRGTGGATIIHRGRRCDGPVIGQCVVALLAEDTDGIGLTTQDLRRCHVIKFHHEGATVYVTALVRRDDRHRNHRRFAAKHRSRLRPLLQRDLRRRGTVVVQHCPPTVILQYDLTVFVDLHNLVLRADDRRGNRIHQLDAEDALREVTRRVRRPDRHVNARRLVGVRRTGGRRLQESDFVRVVTVVGGGGHAPVIREHRIASRVHAQNRIGCAGQHRTDRIQQDHRDHTLIGIAALVRRRDRHVERSTEIHDRGANGYVLLQHDVGCRVTVVRHGNRVEVAYDINRTVRVGGNDTLVRTGQFRTDLVHDVQHERTRRRIPVSVVGRQRDLLRLHAGKGRSGRGHLGHGHVRRIAVIVRDRQGGVVFNGGRTGRVDQFRLRYRTGDHRRGRVRQHQFKRTGRRVTVGVGRRDRDRLHRLVAGDCRTGQWFLREDDVAVLLAVIGRRRARCIVLQHKLTVRVRVRRRIRRAGGDDGRDRVPQLQRKLATGRVAVRIVGRQGNDHAGHAAVQHGQRCRRLGKVDLTAGRRGGSHARPLTIIRGGRVGRIPVIWDQEFTVAVDVGGEAGWAVHDHRLGAVDERNGEITVDAVAAGVRCRQCDRFGGIVSADQGAGRGDLSHHDAVPLVTHRAYAGVAGVVGNRNFAVVIGRQLLVGGADDHRVGTVFQHDDERTGGGVSAFVFGGDRHDLLGPVAAEDRAGGRVLRQNDVVRVGTVIRRLRVGRIIHQHDLTPAVNADRIVGRADNHRVDGIDQHHVKGAADAVATGVRRRDRHFLYGAFGVQRRAGGR